MPTPSSTPIRRRLHRSFTTIARSFRRRPLLTGAFALSTALALFFAVRFTASALYWHAHQNEPIRPWMTIGYVGRSWQLDPRRIDALAELPSPVRGRPLTIAEIAAARGVDAARIIERVEAAIAELTAREPSHGPTSPPR